MAFQAGTGEPSASKAPPSPSAFTSTGSSSGCSACTSGAATAHSCAQDHLVPFFHHSCKAKRFGKHFRVCPARQRGPELVMPLETVGGHDTVYNTVLMS